mmetsp:Transcript_31317/g.66643  ORF Transcript_31317/g.66643 Transcript_31317/m.66643 type:complete len:219 (-) Transcript_31317:180-836(-)
MPLQIWRWTFINACGPFVVIDAHLSYAPSCHTEYDLCGAFLVRREGKADGSHHGPSIVAHSYQGLHVVQPSLDELPRPVEGIDVHHHPTHVQLHRRLLAARPGRRGGPLVPLHQIVPQIPPRIVVHLNALVLLPYYVQRRAGAQQARHDDPLRSRVRRRQRRSRVALLLELYAPVARRVGERCDGFGSAERGVHYVREELVPGDERRRRRRLRRVVVG